MVLNTTFNSISVLFVEETPEYPQKTNKLQQVTDILYYIMLHPIHHTMSWIRNHIFSGNRY
jgi:hypothetical protein